MIDMLNAFWDLITNPLILFLLGTGAIASLIKKNI